MEMSMKLIDIGLFRSWCLQLPEATHEVSGKEEYFKVHNNTFAMIASNGIRIKCIPDNFKKRFSIRISVFQNNMDSFIGFGFIAVKIFILKIFMNILSIPMKLL
ncbi:MAG: hypothetical protein OMM_13905 [Candidatus Magnetoglobus multicellularis str. Araruama]|uniref:Uncharacterized protein n=1 Tax=Candidatus Magnetoglobus multicellularis str. Araruama TaxID=890399 RepID=A0A1V1NST8_9BACT|nr:MAG: hypothetical protein OMM_13905 [Candidatus Magnetoglobus multicellularis str. Araruama]